MKNESEKIVSWVKDAIKKTENNETILTDEIFAIDGMSGRKGRILLNNLVYDSSNYLEVGSWKGSTLCSALYKKNTNRSYSIDDYSQFGNPKDTLENNLKKFVNNYHTHIESDCFNIDLEKHNIKDIDIYFYDGGHLTDEQYKAVTYFINSMSNVFILIVDDWNGTGDTNVKKGTMDAINDLNLITHLYVSLPEENILNNQPHGDSNGYWNGLGVFVLEKK